MISRPRRVFDNVCTLLLIGPDSNHMSTNTVTNLCLNAFSKILNEVSSIYVSQNVKPFGNNLKFFHKHIYYSKKMFPLTCHWKVICLTHRQVFQLVMCTGHNALISLALSSNLFSNVPIKIFRMLSTMMTITSNMFIFTMKH